MHFAGLSYLAIVFAAVAGFAFGAAYYITLGNRWMLALGKTKDEIKRQKAFLPFVIAGVAQLVMAYILAGAIGHLGFDTVNVRNGVITGLFMWAGFVLTTVSVNYAFQGQKPMLTLIDAGHWLGVLALQGLIIGWIGV